MTTIPASTSLIVAAMFINGAAAAPLKQPMSKPDENGACFYVLTEREKQAFGDECFYQPRGVDACLPETCRDREPPKASPLPKGIAQ
jgi:hypothetical protein